MPRWFKLSIWFRFIFHASCPHIREVHGYDPLWIVAGVSAGLLTATVEQVKNNLLLSTYNAMVQADVISGHSQISFIYLSFQFFFSINISKKNWTEGNEMLQMNHFSLNLGSANKWERSLTCTFFYYLTAKSKLYKEVSKVGPPPTFLMQVMTDSKCMY